MPQYVDPNHGWRAAEEIAAAFPDYFVDGWCMGSSTALVHFTKNPWGVPVCHLIHPRNARGVPQSKTLSPASSGNIPPLPLDFGPWVKRSEFDLKGPFLKGHVYRITSGVYSRRPERWPSHLRDVEAVFLGIEERMDTFHVLKDFSKNVDKSPNDAPAMPGFVGTTFGHEHLSPAAAIRQDNDNPLIRRVRYVGPSEA